MSEELQSKYLKSGKIIGQKLGEFEYFQIGASTFNQLKQANIISGGFNKEYDSHKPDRLITDRRGQNPIVIAVVEDKRNGKFNSASEKLKAIQQCNNYCQELGAKIGIITDGEITTWINPQETTKDFEYTDIIVGKKRSYSLIKKEDGSEIIRNFQISEKDDLPDLTRMVDETRKIYKLITELSQKINKNNSIIKEPDRIDPLPLALRVWQDIWVATGKSPEKCLYNVVEIFIFKFLSDLKVLQEPQNFEYLYNLIGQRDNKFILEHYANSCRPKIRELFPKSTEDGTTIINGTIFVNEDEKPNFGQATLFCNSLKKFKDFEKEQGTFEHIDKDFKTKLFETFLKQSEGQKALGQYFTPRKVVQAIVRMSGIENLKQGARFCDPFCGVGGFVLEPINLYRMTDFEPNNGKIMPPITYFGFDKGFEKDEERTIILAKANMLLYLTEIISKNPNLTKEFSHLFNEVFRLWQSNLGTLEHIFNDEKDKFDLILTNPPYVTSGSSTIKNEIAENADLDKFYSVSAGGVEGLALEWIIRNLKRGGKAFVVVPDGILNRLNDKKMRQFILDECYLDGILSLPIKTFFSTPKKTYILALTKKDNKEDKQNFPVFTYLVTNIGETLDVNRFEIPENDLIEATKLFRTFQANKNDHGIKTDLEKSKRCKIQPLEEFDPEKHWSVDRWWDKDEKIALGIEEEEQEVSASEFLDLINETIEELGSVVKENSRIIKKKLKKQSELEFNEISLSNKEYFSLTIGKRLLKKDLFKNKINRKATIPAYSANVLVPFGYVENSNIISFKNPYILWGIDGNFDLSYKASGEVFASTDHCGTIEVLDKNIDPEYLLLALNLKKYEYGFDRGLRSNLVNVKRVELSIPIDKKGDFDLSEQKKIIERNRNIILIQTKLQTLEKEILNTNISFDEEFEGKEIKINNIIDFPETNSKITKAFCIKNEGDIPVYASSKSEFSTLGHIADDLRGVKYYNNCLSWNRNGSVGYVFIRNHKFATNEDHRAMIIKKEFKDILDMQYLKYEIQRALFLNGFSFLDKCGVSKIQNVTIKIPINAMNEFDLGRQREIAQGYEKVEKIKKDLTEKFNLLSSYKILLD